MSILKNKIHRLISSISSQLNLKLHFINRAHKYVYKQGLGQLRVKRSPDTKTAVVLHLYYTESWPKIQAHLKCLSSLPFDLFITLPESKKSFSGEIRQRYPEAHILTVPNRGRDVLPFLTLARELQQKGYESVLKLHTKKSTHRTDGADWFDQLLKSLLPANPSVIKQLISTLNNPDTGIIGPKGQYLQLSVNFEANGAHMTHLLNRMYNRDISHNILQAHRVDYGFFAGTMFWMRLDAISPLLNLRLSPPDFETEGGQIDGTIAHALERLMSLVPEVEKRRMYEISDENLTQTSYKTNNIPDWSSVYIGPKQ